MAATRLTDFAGYLEPTMAAPIFAQAKRVSAFQQLIPQTPLGITGAKIPVVTGKPTAAWVGEGEEKPVTDGSMGLKTIEPKKLAAIWVTSAEVIRANPGNITQVMRDGLAEAFAAAFDYAVGYGLGGNGTGTGPFGDYLAKTTKSVELGTTSQANGGVYGDLVAATKLLVADKKRLTGWAFGDMAEPMLWGATDTNGHPLFVDLPTDNTSAGLARPGRLLGRPSWIGEGVANDTQKVVGFAGDFTKAAWGAVGGISYRVSTETALKINGEMVSLFQNNLVAVLAEAEYGFVVGDVDAFVKLTDAVA